jgi:hypothetical protein
MGVKIEIHIRPMLLPLLQGKSVDMVEVDGWYVIGPGIYEVLDEMVCTVEKAVWTREYLKTKYLAAYSKFGEPEITVVVEQKWDK